MTDTDSALDSLVEAIQNRAREPEAELDVLYILSALLWDTLEQVEDRIAELGGEP